MWVAHVHMYMKFLCLALWQGEVCTDKENDANTDTDANDDERWTIHGCIRLFG